MTEDNKPKAKPLPLKLTKEQMEATPEMATFKLDAPKCITCDCGENKELKVGEYERLMTCGAGGNKDFYVCKDNGNCLSKVKKEIKKFHTISAEPEAKP